MSAQSLGFFQIILIISHILLVKSHLKLNFDPCASNLYPEGRTHQDDSFSKAESQRPKIIRFPIFDAPPLNTSFEKGIGARQLKRPKKSFRKTAESNCTAVQKPYKAHHSQECDGRLAQLVEHLVYTERVSGSNPLPPTIPFPHNIRQSL